MSNRAASKGAASTMEMKMEDNNEDQRTNDVARITIEILSSGVPSNATTYYVREGGNITIEVGSPVKTERNVGCDIVSQTVRGPTSLRIAALLDPTCHYSSPSE